MDKDVLHEGVFLALQEPANIADPYPLYRRLRSESPFHWDFVLGGWFLTRFADVWAALIDPRLTTKNFSFDVTQLTRQLQNDLAPLGAVRSREVLYNDAPDHERLRRPLNRAFHPASFEPLRPKLESLARQLLGKAERRGGMDAVSDYSRPLGEYMFGEVLGLPQADRTDFLECCDQVSKFMTSRRRGRETVIRAKRAVKGFEAVRSYVYSMIATRQRQFVDDLIGRSLAVEPNEPPPTGDEILANCVFFLDAGVRNMSASIANAVFALLRNPQQFVRLREAPGGITTAVEELLRYETPVQVAIRGVPEQIEFAGRQIGPNRLLVLLLGAANRDPEQFVNPDKLNLTRRPNRHVAFGVGPHGCVGGWMARFGLTIAIEAILNQQSEFRLTASKLDWNLPAMRRTMHSLPITIHPRTPHRGRPGMLKGALTAYMPRKPIAIR
jgi:pimeloyl-[acyl-carrier protein] synthase